MCKSCNVLYINHIKCHEISCPDAWMDYLVKCKWCGSEFKPEEAGQAFCDESCYYAYNDYDYYDELEEPE